MNGKNQMFKFINLLTVWTSTIYACVLALAIVIGMIIVLGWNAYGEESLGAYIPIFWAFQLPWWAWLTYFSAFNLLTFRKIKRMHVNKAKRILENIK
jgi:hypothetical protein